MWLMGEEVQESIELEKFRALNNALGSNASTSPEYIKSLLEETQEEEVFETDEEWVTPEGIEDIQRMLTGLG